jgi:hypothetical protein
MSLEKLFKTNKKMEREGILIDYGPNEDLPGDPPPSIRFRVARSGGSNVAYSKVLERITKPWKRALQNGQVSNERAKEMDREAFIEACLLGWENVTLGGQVLEFSAANAKVLFETLPDMYDDLREQAGSSALFREETREADLGNSGTSLPTDSSKATSSEK